MIGRVYGYVRNIPKYALMTLKLHQVSFISSQHISVPVSVRNRAERCSFRRGLEALQIGFKNSSKVYTAWMPEYLCVTPKDLDFA